MLRLNGMAADALGRPEAVVLMIDPPTGALGLKPTSSDMPNAYRAGRDRGNSVRLMCRSLLKENNIKLASTVTFPTARVEDGVAHPGTKIPRPVAQVFAEGITRGIIFGKYGKRTRAFRSPF